jgi:tetrathionate reductase subunit B
MPKTQCAAANETQPGEGAQFERTGETGVPRRTFLRLALAGAASAGVGAKTIRAQHREDLEVSTSSPYALVIDTTKCTGCGACVEGCRLQNGLPDGHSYIRLLQRGPEQEPYFMPVQCQHCASPPCATVCPTNATYVHPEGVVLVNTRLCVGCKYCMTACPYQARIFDKQRGVVDKCWLCLDRVHAGKLPACVEACVVGARMFGRTDDPDSKVSKLIASGCATPLHPEFNTHPGILTYVIEE